MNVPYAHVGASSSAQSRIIRVLVADDHQLLREGIQSVLERTPDIRVVASVMDGDAALQAFKTLIPDLTLMDVRMPGAGGIEAIAAIRAYAPCARIIALSTYGGDALISKARKAGASAYLLKSMLSDSMLNVIRAVHDGRQSWPEPPDEMVLAHGSELSPRELEVIQLVAKGASNREIGAVLGISAETVKTYMRIILPKLRANDRAHAVAISMQRGFIDASKPG